MNQQRPKYLPLTNDLVFKRYFTTNKPLLLSLINSILPISDRVSDAIVTNPHDAYAPYDPAQLAKQPRQSGDPLILKDTSIPPHRPHGKSVVLDLNVKLSNGENINIEMQTSYERGFRHRMLYYSHMLSDQDIGRGDDFSKLNPTYSLIFTNFTLFKGKRNAMDVMEFVFSKQPDYNTDMPIKFAVVELNKFKKNYDQLINMKERWFYIMKHADKLTPKAEAYLLQHGGVKMALEYLEEISKSDQLYQDAIARKKDRVAMQLARIGALEEGMKAGRAQGMQEGRAQGMQEGRTQGMQEGRTQGMQEGELNKARKIALVMLQKGLEVSLISEATGLSVAEIEQLNHRTAD